MNCTCCPICGGSYTLSVIIVLAQRLGEKIGEGKGTGRVLITMESRVISIHWSFLLETRSLSTERTFGPRRGKGLGLTEMVLDSRGYLCHAIIIPEMLIGPRGWRGFVGVSSYGLLGIEFICRPVTELALLFHVALVVIESRFHWDA